QFAERVDAVEARSIAFSRRGTGGHGELGPFFQEGRGMGSTRRNVVAFVVGCVVIAASGGFAAINATTASADPPTPFTQCPAVGAATSCNILIVLDDSGAHVYTDSNVSPFDLGETNPNGEDTLVGVENDSSTTVSSLPLSSSTVDIFGFDAD